MKDRCEGCCGGSAGDGDEGGCCEGRECGCGGRGCRCCGGEGKGCGCCGEGCGCCGEGKGCGCCGGGKRCCDDGPDDEREHRGGPPGTEFLDLEISQVLYAEAAGLARDVTREILKEQIHARLRERLGERLAKIAVLAADEVADDVEANLAIEATIARRREQKAATKDRLRAALADDAEAAPGAEGSSRGEPKR